MIEKMVDKEAEVLIKSAVKFLLEGGENEAAWILLNCRGTILEHETYNSDYVMLYGPRIAYDALNDSENPITKAVSNAFWALNTPFRIQAEMVDAPPNWRDDMYELIRGRGITNQGDNIQKPVIYENL